MTLTDSPSPALRGRAELTGHGLTDLRAGALRIVDAGLAAVDPREGLRRYVRRVDDLLWVGERSYDLASLEHIWLLGAGKASLHIAEGVSELLGDRLSGGVVVVQRGAARPVRGIDVREADHPVPGPDSHAAATALLELADGAGPRDLLITAFTGGSSALASLPPAGVSTSAKQDLHRLLITSGAPIEQINAVRKHVSAIKGGRLARAAAPAAVVNLTVPDVVSGRLDCITDPTVADESSVLEAVAVLRSRGLWEQVDPAIRAHLDGPAAQSPSLDDVDVHTVMLTDGEQACTAMSAAAEGLGLSPQVFGTRIEGEAATVGALLAALATETVRNSRPFSAPCALLGAGGEAVVTFATPQGRDAPLGGPNQETALAFAAAIAADVPVAAVFLDSDGSDGGTPYAGAVVDATSRTRADALGIDFGTALLEHASTATFDALGDLLHTGPTHTNVSDLWVVVIGSTQ